MPQYVIGREGLTVPATPAPISTLKSAAAVVGRINEIFVSGEGVASLVQRLALKRSSTDGITPVAQTPAKTSPTQQAAQCTSATSFSTNPVFAAVPSLWATALNVFGGIVRWAASPGQELYVIGASAGSDEVSLSGPTGAGAITDQIIFEEL